GRRGRERRGSSRCMGLCVGYPLMAQLDARDVVRDGPFPLCDLAHLVRGNEQEGRLLVDEPADQPGARDPVDPRSLSSHPPHVSLRYLVSALLLFVSSRPAALDMILGTTTVCFTAVDIIVVSSSPCGASASKTRWP